MGDYYKDRYEETLTEMYHAYRKIGCRDSRIKMLTEAIKRIRDCRHDVDMVRVITDLWIESAKRWETEDVD